MTLKRIPFMSREKIIFCDLNRKKAQYSAIWIAKYYIMKLREGVDQFILMKKIIQAQNITVCKNQVINSILIIAESWKICLNLAPCAERIFSTAWKPMSLPLSRFSGFFIKWLVIDRDTLWGYLIRLIITSEPFGEYLRLLSSRLTNAMSGIFSFISFDTQFCQFFVKSASLNAHIPGCFSHILIIKLKLRDNILFFKCIFHKI